MSDLIQKYNQVDGQLKANELLLYRVGGFYVAFGSHAKRLAEAARRPIHEWKGTTISGVTAANLRKFIRHLVTQSNVALIERVNHRPHLTIIRP